MNGDPWSIAAGDLRIERFWPECVMALRLPLRTTSEQVSALGARLNLPLPQSCEAGGTPRTLWLGPGEFMILGRVTPVSVNLLFHLSDMTNATIAYHLRGARVRELLSKGCTLDLHPRSFAINRCARTLIAQVEVVIDRLNEDGFDLYAERSYADHLERWLADAAAEFCYESRPTFNPMPTDIASFRPGSNGSNRPEDRFDLKGRR